MFDTTSVFLPGYGRSETHNHVTMVDPSVEKGARFLGEVQEKVLSQITNAVLVGVPAIDVSAVRYDYETSFLRGETRHRLAFTIGHKVFDVGLSHDERDEPKAILRALAEEIARTIVLGAVVPTITRKPHGAFCAVEAI